MTLQPTANRLNIAANTRLAIVHHQIEALRPDPKNPRHHSRRQLRQIARSIKAFGFNVPVLVDADLRVIAGHGRISACRELGITEVPTICLDHLSEAQRKAFMIADNRLTETSIWDEKLLAEQLKELSLLDLEFDLEATGFEMAELDLRIESLGSPSETETDPADAIPLQPDTPAVTQPGDVWVLGRHRIICGNALAPLTYSTLLQNERAAVVFTDPPYNVPINGHVSGLGSVRHREFAMACGEMDETQFTEFLVDACRNAANHSCDGAIHFVCMDWRHMRELLSAGAAVYSELKNVCVWVKHNAGMGSLYRSQHELVFVFKHGQGAHRNNIELGRFGRHRTNVWNYPGATSIGRNTNEGNLIELHPTVKPVGMVQDAILDCSGRGEIVLDPFLGSGTTLIAAERTGRTCFGIEIDPLYCDTAMRRWQAITGEAAKHQATGKTLTETIVGEGEVNVRR